MTAGIYMMVNIITRKKYIGQSFKIEKRWKQHFAKGKLENNNGRLYDAIREHGKVFWEIFILWELEDSDVVNSREILWKKEIEFISAFDTTNPEKGYNLAIGGPGPNGFHPSDESRKKMSEAGKGREKTEEHKRKIGEAHKGKVVSKESIEKMREKLTGRKNPEHSKRMMGNKNWRFRKTKNGGEKQI